MKVKKDDAHANHQKITRDDKVVKIETEDDSSCIVLPIGSAIRKYKKDSIAWTLKEELKPFRPKQ